MALWSALCFISPSQNDALSLLETGGVIQGSSHPPRARIGSVLICSSVDEIDEFLPSALSFHILIGNPILWCGIPYGCFVICFPDMLEACTRF